MLRPALALLLTASLLVTSTAVAKDDDQWLGWDKALHFTASFGLAAGGYAACAAATKEQWAPLACGAGISLGAGIGKEVLDLAGLGDPSWRDLAWDGIGTATGLLAAYAIDRFVLRPSRPPATEPARLRVVPDPVPKPQPDTVTVLLDLRRVLAEAGVVPSFAVFARPSGAPADTPAREATP